MEGNQKQTRDSKWGLTKNVFKQGPMKAWEGMRSAEGEMKYLARYEQRKSGSTTPRGESAEQNRETPQKNTKKTQGYDTRALKNSNRKGNHEWSVESVMQAVHVGSKCQVWTGVV